MRDARELRNLWPPRMREINHSAFVEDPPLQVLRSSLGIAVFLFEARVTAIRDEKRDDGKSRTDRLEEEVARARAERQERGEL